jgi:hypothetical protein
MDDLLNNDDVVAFFGGVEPMDVGDLSDVKEERQVIPNTKNVKLQIIKAENQINKAGTFRQINLQCKIVDGIDEQGKYKNKIIFTRVTYYADPNAYTSDFFKKRQYLIALKFLKNAIGWESSTIDGHFLAALDKKILKGDIVIRKNKRLVDDGTGNKVEIEQLDNEIRNFKALSPEESV